MRTNREMAVLKQILRCVKEASRRDGGRAPITANAARFAARDQPHGAPTALNRVGQSRTNHAYVRVHTGRQRMGGAHHCDLKCVGEEVMRARGAVDARRTHTHAPIGK